MRRVRQLEQRPTLKYLGVWSADIDYAEGSAVTHDGSIFIAGIKSKGLRPGNGTAGWKLAVKHGRNGKDAPPPPGRIARA
jgi:hypothetical protein